MSPQARFTRVSVAGRSGTAGWIRLTRVACEPLSYSEVDDSKWESVRNLVAREYDIPIESESGEASKKGFTLSWTYDRDQRTLEIQCVKKPFFVPCGAVNDRIKGLADRLG
jgi:hypothetical protein